MTTNLAPHAKRGRRGFSLLELMIAMSVIAIALFSILGMITQMMAMRDLARENELAKEWVQRRLEEVKSTAFAQVPTTYPAGTTGAYVGSFSASTLPVDKATPPQLANAAGLLSVNYNNNANLYEIVATITWKARKGTGTYAMRNLYCAPAP
ncbi:MAG TPA: type II secretion system protein [Planctomycetota bacterium]|nr:type II secretion system protein [Planctomycetota bacterium]